MTTASERTTPLPLDACIGLTGRVLSGQYRIVAQLGAGGMGAIYEAEQLSSGQRFAIKMLLDQIPDREQVARRFAREANATRWLDHPNIVEVLDIGTTDTGDLFLVMELVRGKSLRQVLDDGPVGARRSLVIARQALQGLSHAHTSGMVHRDLKPENIMLARRGPPGGEYDQVKLLDFGLVKLLNGAASELGGDKLTRTGVVFGTPAYMAPEQVLGRVLDHRADLYAFGVVLFEMLTGWLPFRSPDPMTLMRMQAGAPIPTLASIAPGRPFCTAAVEHLVAKTLAKRPEQRFADAAEMIAALDAAFTTLDHLPAEA